MIPKPVWPYWANLHNVPLEVAVLLSLNIDPRWRSEADTRHSTSDRAKWDEVEPSYTARHDAATSHAQARKLRTTFFAAEMNFGLREQRGERTMVVLPDFRQWGESLPNPFTFPDEFPRPAAPAAVPIDAPQAAIATGSKPLREDARENYLRIIRALLELADVRGHGTASAIFSKLKALSFDVDPSKPDAIEKALKAARDLNPDNARATRK